MSEHIGRRQFLGTTLALGAAASTTTAAQDTPDEVAAALKDNVYTKVLGVRPHLGAHEHISRLSGSRMTEETMVALAEANRFFVDMDELNDAAGAKVAELLGAEAAMITSGGFSSMIRGRRRASRERTSKNATRYPILLGRNASVSSRRGIASATTAPTARPG